MKVEAFHIIYCQLISSVLTISIVNKYSPFQSMNIYCLKQSLVWDLFFCCGKEETHAERLNIYARFICCIYLFLLSFRKALLSKVILALLRRPLERSPVKLNTRSAKACEAGMVSRSNARGFSMRNVVEHCEDQNSIPD